MKRYQRGLYIALFIFTLTITGCSINDKRPHQPVITDDATPFLKATLEEAHKQSKPVFLEIYASWCKYCTNLHNKTLADPKVKRYLDDHFITMRIDSEEGEGPALMRKFNVGAFPTLIFLNEKGKVLIRGKGFKTSDELIQLAERARQVQ